MPTLYEVIQQRITGNVSFSPLRYRDRAEAQALADRINAKAVDGVFYLVGECR